LGDGEPVAKRPAKFFAFWAGNEQKQKLSDFMKQPLALVGEPIYPENPKDLTTNLLTVSEGPEKPVCVGAFRVKVVLRTPGVWTDEKNHHERVRRVCDPKVNGTQNACVAS
jgi:hypothetical protein